MARTLREANAELDALVAEFEKAHPDGRFTLAEWFDFLHEHGYVSARDGGNAS